MSRILEEASYLARCSDNKTAMRVRPREYAIRYPYMQVNRPTHDVMARFRSRPCQLPDLG